MMIVETQGVLEAVRHDLRENADEEVRSSGRRFFKEEVTSYGVKTTIVTGIAKKHFSAIKNEAKETVFGLCEELWRSGYLEESFIACDWSYALRRRYRPDDLEVFETWVNRYVDNWASCDTLCNHTVGALVEMYPACSAGMSAWAKSDNRWMKRAAAVSFIIPARKGLFLDDIFSIAGILLSDRDDMVQKGYGWMLKAASEAHRDKVFDFVMEKKDVMPRTALRYAIEKMPKEMRTEAMKKA